jgi:hypothetical protein
VATGFGRDVAAGPMAAVAIGADRAPTGWIDTQSPSQAIRIPA